MKYTVRKIMLLSVMLKMSLCANLCNRRKFQGVCCENDGWGPVCALESTTVASVCISNAAATALTPCMMSVVTHDCTNVLTGKSEIAFQSSTIRTTELEYMSGEKMIS